MVFQGSGFSVDAGMLLSALLYASSAAFFFTWSSAFGASCCCLFPFAMAWAGAVTASNVIAIAAVCHINPSLSEYIETDVSTGVTTCDLLGYDFTRSPSGTKVAHVG